MRSLILTTALLALAACVTSPVVELDTGNYLVSIHTVFGVTTQGQLIEKAAAAAEQYCEEHNLVAHIKNSVGAGITGLTNLSGNVVFSCVTPGTSSPPAP